jgi:hypothetical protein
MIKAYAGPATLMPSGMVLVVGGIGAGPRGDAELYEPGSGLWTATANVLTRRSGHTATLLPDGKLLVAGGQSTSPMPLASSELYDEGSRDWRSR